MRNRRLKDCSWPLSNRSRYYYVDKSELSISLDRDDSNERHAKSALRDLSVLRGRIIFVSIDTQEVAQCIRELADE